MTIDKTSVAVEHADSQWVVHVTVDGIATQRSFDLEEHAKSFAAGQRMRLRLPPVVDGDHNN